jgi:hypothetical protein
VPNPHQTLLLVLLLVFQFPLSRSFSLSFSCCTKLL